MFSYYRMCFLEKVAAFTHQELNVPEWRRRDAIQHAIEVVREHIL